ncbi:MAG: hypothetical protein HQL30_06440 [Candidatus Omnitrophica bacterium]|nr:hypothetical protein [Candidatus Omnitrophota bacterium]
MGLIVRVVKLLMVTAVIASVVTAGVFAYFSTYGKGLIEKTLSGVLGSAFEFRTVSLDISSCSVSFKGVTFENVIGLEPKVFNAEKFTVKLNSAAFEKEKKIVLDEIFIDGASMNIERGPDGKIGLMYPVPRKDGTGETGKNPKFGSEPGLHDMLESVRKITVRNSVVRFWDNMFRGGSFLVMCDNVSMDITVDTEKGRENGYVDEQLSSSFDITNMPNAPGQVRLGAGLKVYRPFIEASVSISAGNVDIKAIKPYLDLYTPFIFTQGVFDADLRADLSRTDVNSLTTIYFHSVNVAVNPAKRDTEFLEASVAKIVPYLTSNQGGIVFDFIVSGPVKAPAVTMGPKLKEAAGMVVMGEVGRYIQNMQNIK